MFENMILVAVVINNPLRAGKLLTSIHQLHPVEVYTPLSSFNSPIDTYTTSYIHTSMYMYTPESSHFFRQFPALHCSGFPLKSYPAIIIAM